jgi:2,3-bisphosphoglycerate-independent phosphoglycerate mutase
MSRPKPVVLCILDGWGVRAPAKDNAITLAHTPCMDHLLAAFPNTLLRTSGLDVGLPEGQMGNSEVGHMNIGSGRVVMQDLPRIDSAIQSGELANNPMLQKLITQVKAKQGKCHLLGLLSDGGVHAHQEHILALSKIVASQGIKVEIHAFLDGRDTPPNSAVSYIAEFEKAIANEPNIRIATISGRYYAMDRDKRWDRVTLAYNAIALGKGSTMTKVVPTIEAYYKNNKYDEFILPTVLEGYQGVHDGDALLMANFRADRAREILQALVDPDCTDIIRPTIQKWSAAVGLVEYSERLNRWMEAMFLPVELDNILGEVVARQGLKQLRIAETEKYAHVTFFFNAGREEPFEGESRILIPSPQVATYDLRPEMSAGEITNKLVEVIGDNHYDLIIVNYANTDMVGHSGDIAAAIKAVEAVDRCLEKLFKAVNDKHGILIITADHGNAEQMLDEKTGIAHTAHTTGPVPLIVAGETVHGIRLKSGRLCDIAPTVLELMNIDKPYTMTGETLIT